jgi:uncharacterized protein YcbK (DUF882 family)
VDLILRLQEVREILGQSIFILSGYRCERWNDRVGGVRESAHTRGLAADIRAHTPTYRFHLLGAIFRSGLFGRVGIAEHYVHVDIDADKPQEVAWVYP